MIATIPLGRLDRRFGDGFMLGSPVVDGVECGCSWPSSSLQTEGGDEYEAFGDEL
jgi:hypothetical protein